MYAWLIFLFFFKNNLGHLYVNKKKQNNIRRNVKLKNKLNSNLYFLKNSPRRGGGRSTTCTWLGTVRPHLPLSAVGGRLSPVCRWGLICHSCKIVDKYIFFSILLYDFDFLAFLFGKFNFCLVSQLPNSLRSNCFFFSFKFER